MTKRGAPAAYKGYRLQALYILKRILTQGENESIFRPEGNEDLDVLDSDGNLIEAVQVKSIPGLALSHLYASDGTQSKGSVKPFFHRAVDLIKTHHCNDVKLVNFNYIGSELEQAWSDILFPYASRKKISGKLEKKGLQPDDIDLVFSNVALICLDEDTVKSEVFNLLGNIFTGIDPASAFDLLNFRIYPASEKQQSLTKPELIEMIQNVGKFLAECRARHAKWFTSIKPIENRKPHESLPKNGNWTEE